MKARDVMVSPVVTVKLSATLKAVGKRLCQISAVPVVDEQGKLVGIVSEGDLVHRAKIGTEQRHSWWLLLLAEDHGLAAGYIKTHGRKVEDVVTRNVVTATPNTPLNEIAGLLEKHGVKRVPIVWDGQLVGIVSIANLVQAVASTNSKLEIPVSDATIRDHLVAHLNAQPWTHTLNATVNDGIVDLWGITGSETERKAVRVAAETMAGVRAVNDHMIARQMETLVQTVGVALKARTPVLESASIAQGRSCTRRRTLRHLALRGTPSAIGATEEWIGDLQRHLGYAIACTPPSALRDVLAQYQVAYVGAQLPALLRGLYYVAWHPSVGTLSRSRSAFIERIQDGMHRDEHRYRGSQARRACVAGGRPCRGRARGCQGAQTAA